MTKKQIRVKILKKLKAQKEVIRLKKSFEIHKKLFALPQFLKAKIILFYLSFGGEVETFGMITKAIALGKKIAVPVIDKINRKFIPSFISGCGYDLESGPYTILQPKPECIQPVGSNRIDLVVVPAVAFDLEGNRIGRGMGYYDRFLHSLPKKTASVGLAFDFQVLQNIPAVQPHDIPVKRVVCA